VEANFNPALGFISRTDVRDITTDGGYTHFTNGSFVQSIFSGIDVQRVNFLDGGLQSQLILGRLVELRTNSGERFQVHYSETKEVVTEPFRIYEDESRQVVVPRGTYSFGETEIQARTGGQRMFSGRVTYRTGKFYGGTRNNIGGEFSWKQSRNFIVTLNYDINDINLPQGDFITRLMRFTTETNFSTNLSWINLIQYDNVSEVLGFNTRLRWIPEAGQEALIVLNHSLEDPDNDNSFQSQLADLTVKVSYTFRF
jgi:hypothetical protein